MADEREKEDANKESEDEDEEEQGTRKVKRYRTHKHLQPPSARNMR